LLPERRSSSDGLRLSSFPFGTTDIRGRALIDRIFAEEDVRKEAFGLAEAERDLKTTEMPSKTL
jgi:hypothetical protein